jgi:chemotaxis protein MotB
VAKPEPKIVKKIYKKAAHGHHGGAWKIAYADFVTAMMAFFLLMWLISSVTDEQKRGIADYFAPSMIKVESRAGNNGMLAGQNVMGENNSDMRGLGNNETRNDIQKETVSTVFSKKQVKTDQQQQEQKKTESTSKQESAEQKKAMDDVNKDPKEAMKQIEEKIKRAIEENSNLRKYANNIIFELTEEGLNIVVSDQEDTPMFPAGSYQMYDQMKEILSEITKSIVDTHNKIAITGHTEAVQFASTKNYSNWELSADRANSTRRALLESGIAADRFSYVRGMESTKPFDRSNTAAPTNRRVDITLLYNKGGG